MVSANSKDGGYYRSTFVANMWDEYNNATPTQVSLPAFDKLTGDHDDTDTPHVTVTLSAENSDPLKIYYTLNGDAPTESETGTNFLYDVDDKVQITFTNPTTVEVTLKVLAVDDTYTDSDVATAIYTYQVIDPEILPVKLDHSGPINVTITTTTSGASIYYTLDGSEPDATDTLYSSAISISGLTTVKARAFKVDLPPSDTVGKSYTFSSGWQSGIEFDTIDFTAQTTDFIIYFDLTPDSLGHRWGNGHRWG